MLTESFPNKDNPGIKRGVANHPHIHHKSVWESNLSSMVLLYPASAVSSGAVHALSHVRGRNHKLRY
jgi:hypothetical protein